MNVKDLVEAPDGEDLVDSFIAIHNREGAFIFPGGIV